jgi:hypothetical protein
LDDYWLILKVKTVGIAGTGLTGAGAGQELFTHRIPAIITRNVRHEMNILINLVPE